MGLPPGYMNELGYESEIAYVAESAKTSESEVKMGRHSE